jgi:general secretion pathway protein G
MVRTEEAPRRRKSHNGGFTLVELMVVISIIAILATIVGYNVLGATDDAAVAQAKAQIRSFKTALISYKLKYKKFPTSLDALITNDRNFKFLDSEELPMDPWGNPYQYNSDGSTFKIVSLGSDGSAGGSEYASDISSDNLQAESK